MMRRTFLFLFGAVVCALTQAGVSGQTLDIYQAVGDVVARAKPALPALGPAGSTWWTDPSFNSRLWRITDGRTRPDRPDRSYRTPSSAHQNAWSADGRLFVVVSTDGTVVPFSFDPATATASRLNPVPSGEGGLVLRFYIEPQFSYVSSALIYGSYNGSGSTLRTIDQYNFTTGAYTRLLDLDTLAPGLSGTYVGWIGSSAGSVERIVTFFGGTAQDRHRYAVVFDKANPGIRRLVDTIASTIDGAPTNIPLHFSIHAMAIDRSGQFAMIYPTGVDMAAPRNAAAGYLWNITSGTFTALPVNEARMGGHDAYGYGVRVNQACCTTSTYDAAQWQLRSLDAPLATRDLISPVLLPQQVFLADHPSWNNARADRLVPFISALYRYNANALEWRAWDDEIIAVQTDAAPGMGARVWRFAHHRSDVTSDLDPTRIGFWYTPRPNVSPDGRWALFTSNWEKTLGTDPGGEPALRSRQDVFLLELAQNDPAVLTPVSIVTTSLPEGRATATYSTTLQAAGGSGAFAWSIADGTMPAGLTLDATSGTVSGTPLTSGASTITFRAADAASSSSSADAALTLNVTAAISIVTAALPDAILNRQYSSNMRSANSQGTQIWSVAAGTLPPGLALNPSTGRIAGRGTTPGTWTFTLDVVDVNTRAALELSIRVR